MLRALDEGVKGGRWFSLMDKVWSLKNLRAAFAKVKQNDGAPGTDRQTIGMFEKHLEANLEKLSRELRENREFFMVPRRGHKAPSNPLGKVSDGKFRYVGRGHLKGAAQAHSSRIRDDCSL
jgi:hypothetical protein